MLIQMSTSVRLTTEVVTLRQTAETPSEVSHVPAEQDTLVMDSPAQVCKKPAQMCQNRLLVHKPILEIITIHICVAKSDKNKLRISSYNTLYITRDNK